MRELHVELLLGTKVIDRAGRSVGRIEEVIADRRDGGWIVREVHLGPDALLERLAVTASRIPFLGVLRGARASRRVPWDRLDLSRPDEPRLRCEVDELPR